MGATTTRLWTRDEIAVRILNGENLVIHHGRVLRIPNSWIDIHPGGDLAILHFVGRDASDEVHAFHSDETLRRINGYVVGSVKLGEDGWDPLLPPLMSGWTRTPDADGTLRWVRQATALCSESSTELSPRSHILLVKNTSVDEAASPSLQTLLPPPSDLSPKIQAQQSAAYKALHKRVIDAGLYDTPYITGYGPEVLRYTLLAVLSVWTYKRAWFPPSAFFLGLLWHQLTFFVHDLGHVGVTHNWAVDRIIGITLADFVGGLSVGWWVDNHNVHHLVTNHPSHDPDIEHIPFFAISTDFLKSLYSTYHAKLMTFGKAAKLLLSFQHKLFYVVLSLARFNLYAQSYMFLSKTLSHKPKARGGRWSWWLEIAGIATYWYWYSAVLRGCGSWQMALAYLLTSHITASPVHVQIVLSHFSRSTADLGPVESFPHRQLRTTMDVLCPDHLAFLHGGLHLQVTHHLFPRLPRHNLKKASKFVKEFAREQGLEYAEFGFVEGNHEVRSVLRSVAEQARVVGMVAEAEVQEAVKQTTSI